MQGSKNLRAQPDAFRQPSTQNSDPERLKKLPHTHPTTLNHIWDNALALASTLSDHYAMRQNEQQLALQYALILEPGATLVELGVTHGRTGVRTSSSRPARPAVPVPSSTSSGAGRQDRRPGTARRATAHPTPGPGTPPG